MSFYEKEMEQMKMMRLGRAGLSYTLKVLLVLVINYRGITGVWFWLSGGLDKSLPNVCTYRRDYIVCACGGKKGRVQQQQQQDGNVNACR